MTQLEIYYPTGRDVPAWERLMLLAMYPIFGHMGCTSSPSHLSLRVRSVEAKALRPFGLGENNCLPKGSGRRIYALTSIAWDEDLALRLIVERPSHQKFAGVIWATDRIAAKETGPKDLLLKDSSAPHEWVVGVEPASDQLDQGMAWKGRTSRSFPSFRDRSPLLHASRIPRAPNGTKHWQRPRPRPKDPVRSCRRGSKVATGRRVHHSDGQFNQASSWRPGHRYRSSSPVKGVLPTRFNSYCRD